MEQPRKFEITLLETCPDCMRPLFQDMVHICHGENTSGASGMPPVQSPPCQSKHGFPNF